MVSEEVSEEVILFVCFFKKKGDERERQRRHPEPQLESLVDAICIFVHFDTLCLKKEEEGVNQTKRKVLPEG